MIGSGQKNRGFTIVELLVVVVVIGILSAIVYSTLYRPSSQAYEARADAELSVMANALKLYLAANNKYPEDVPRNLPADIKEFVAVDDDTDDWPNAPYPGSVYDYDAWDALNPNGTVKFPVVACAGPNPLIDDFDMTLCDTYQISIRMCETGQDAVCREMAKRYLGDKVPANVLNLWTSKSAVFYCIKGPCRSHQDTPLNHPGYCVNCAKQPWQQPPSGN